MKNKSLKLLVSFWKGWGYSLLVALVLATSLKSAIADWNVVPTGSMKPTILEGDRIFVDKLAYDLKIPYTTIHLAEWDSPNRGDIVVFYSPTDGTRLVKRVVGVPGDHIGMRNNQLFINGEKLQYEPLNNSSTNRTALEMAPEQYAFIEDLDSTRHQVMISPQLPSLRSFQSITIPEQKYFMMGDNRDNSADSRYFGFVDRDRIVGKATGIVISLDLNHSYKPRLDRFFTKLL